MKAPRSVTVHSRQGACHPEHSEGISDVVWIRARSFAALRMTVAPYTITAIGIMNLPTFSETPFEVLQEGIVTQRKPGTPTAAASGPRTAVTARGEIVCSCMVQSALGINDFKPMISRSRDGGTTWEEQGLIWPHLQETYSIFGSVSRAPDGTLFFFGSRTPIDEPGEPFWSESACGLKPNELIWAASDDGGTTWSEPKCIPTPIPGSAEVPGPLCIMRDGRWVCCYSLYNTFDPKVVVEHNQVVCLSSMDRGQTWTHTSMLRFPDRNSFGAEAWVVELADGRLLGAAWHSNETLGVSQPNAYAISRDGGLTWSPTASTGILGQSCALAALPDGRALFDLQSASAWRNRRLARRGSAHGNRVRHRGQCDHLAS